MRERIVAMAIALSVLGVSCQKASEADDGKRMPKPPPPPAASADVAGVHIDVEIDGQPAPAVDAPRLAATKADFIDEEHRAWKLTTLLGAPADREGVVFAAVGDKGVTIMIPRPSKPSDPTPVLVVTRRGEPLVAMMSPEAPFPPYHGRGGRLHRPGDPSPRVTGVTKIRVTVEREAGDAKSAPPASMDVKIAGKEPQRWNIDTLGKVPRVGADGGAGRDMWSLRDLARTLVGPKARVTVVVGDDGRKAIDKTAWDDKARTPVLRATRDDAKIKFRWIEKDGSLGEAEVKTVVGLEIEP